MGGSCAKRIQLSHTPSPDSYADDVGGDGLLFGVDAHAISPPDIERACYADGGDFWI